MKIKDLVKVMNGDTYISIQKKHTYSECLICGIEWNCMECLRCENQEQLIETYEWFVPYEGKAEKVPFNLIDKNIIEVRTHFEGTGKDGRKTRKTKAIIDVYVKDE